MDISEQSHAGYTILKIEGALTEGTKSTFKDSFNENYKKGIRKLLVDCTKLSRISSLGIRELLNAQRILRKEKGTIALFSVSPELHRFFEIAGVISIFPIYESKQKAISNMGLTDANQ